MIVAVACGIGVSVLLAPATQPRKSAVSGLAVLWPAVIFLLVMTGYLVAVSRSADARYASEPKNHIIWHEVLLGILGASSQLRSEYAGDVRGSPDEVVYAAVLRDINARNDASSPIARRQPDGHLTIDLMSGWADYDKLVKSLTLRIIYQHPVAVLETLPVKAVYQIKWYDPRGRDLGWESLGVPAAIVVLAAALCVAAGGFTSDRRMRRGALCVTATILLFALATPMIHPSAMTVGTLFCYLGVIAILLACGIELLIRPLVQSRMTAPAGPT
jgi:hypothetical protein